MVNVAGLKRGKSTNPQTQTTKMSCKNSEPTKKQTEKMPLLPTHLLPDKKSLSVKKKANPVTKVANLRSLKKLSNMRSLKKAANLRSLKNQLYSLGLRSAKMKVNKPMIAIKKMRPTIKLNAWRNQKPFLSTTGLNPPT